MTDLREKIVDAVSEYTSDPWALADRILALLPPQPKLEWDKNDCLRLGTIVVGYIGLCHPEYRERKRAAVEEAVRKALGWPK